MDRNLVNALLLGTLLLGALLLGGGLLAGCGGGGEAVPDGDEPPAQAPPRESSAVDALPSAAPPPAEEPAAETRPPGESVPPPLEQVQVFLVRLAESEGGSEDGSEGEPAEPRPGGSGTFGCGDRLVGVTVPVATDEAATADRVAAAVRFLLASGGGPEVPGNLYNALERSRLEVAGVRLAPGTEEDEGIYRVELTGSLRLGGVCDNPRVGAQLRATAEQFQGVEEAELYLDGRPLEAVLTGR